MLQPSSSSELVTMRILKSVLSYLEQCQHVNSSVNEISRAEGSKCAKVHQLIKEKIKDSPLVLYR